MLLTHTTRRTTTVVLAAFALGVTSGASAVEGPVILGGDNFPEHGEFNTSTGAVLDGWRNMQHELAWVAPRVGRVNDNSVVALGAHASASLTRDPGAAIGRAATTNALTVTYVDGASAMSTFFADLRTAVARPRVIWLAGTAASNNTLDTAELAVLADPANAATLAMFVQGGGGLIAHGDETVYAGWLEGIAPGLTATSGGGMGGQLTVTPAGAAMVPGLDPAVGAWRSGFAASAGLGNLQPLVVTNGGTPRDVILGGGRTWTTLAPSNLRVTTTTPAKVSQGDIVTYSLSVTNNGPNIAPETVLLHKLPAGVVFRGGTGGPGRDCTVGPPVTCRLGDIPVGATVGVAVLGKIVTAKLATATSTVSADTPDNDPADNTAAHTVRPRTTTLRVAVALPPYDHARNLIRLRVTVRNTGKNLAKSVALRVPSPAGFAFERRPPGARSEGQASIWELGNLRAGGSKTVIFSMRLTGSALGKICVPGRATAANAKTITGRDCLLAYAKHGPGPLPNHPHKGL